MRSSQTPQDANSNRFRCTVLGMRVFAAITSLCIASFAANAMGQERSASGQKRESLLSRALKNGDHSELQNAVVQNLQQTIGDEANGTSTDDLANKILGGPDAWLSPKGFGSSPFNGRSHEFSSTVVSKLLSCFDGPFA